MTVMIEMHHTGCVPAVRSEIEATIEHALADRPRVVAGFDYRLAGKRPMGDEHGGAECIRTNLYVGRLAWRT